MSELISKNDIDRISMEVLKGSKSLDVYPTPVDRIVEYADLLVKKDVDVSQIHPTYKDRANEFLRSALSKVRGIFDVKQRVIYLDLSQGFNRKNFVKLHETAHGILPWQRKIHDIIGDNDQTLNPDHNEEFEAEANYFASVTLFQHDRFMGEVAKLNLSIDAAMHLAKHFGASIHAALRRYVDCSQNRCALLILENMCKTGMPYCMLRNCITSKKFVKAFGEIILPPKLEFSWPFVQDYCSGRKFKKDGQLTLSTKNGEVAFSYQFFNNSYNAFVFLYPIGEIKRSRTTFVVKGIPGY
ncbi:MAG TPA: ImmA/IrrE family metallo-endopeptidase [Flavisolibacter sp.]|nr:ImmA/IrrE family metallo-endopeptidase [Flavisolibacter sp.]